ncbi:MAG: ferritin-like domain-containing protein [Deltaproteobacteria bacterium]|nr:ferritin-like domain-containing protein [Deltaproteobacteria bacterium]
MDRLHPAEPIETYSVSQDVTYNWNYDTPRRQLMRLYDHAKRDQWDGALRLDWSVDVDPESELVPDAAIGIYGTPLWDKLTEREIRKLRHEGITWQLCQFLHGEQGALLAAAQIVDSVPWYEAKQYAATQVVDEARHVEVYRQFVQEKLEHEYPVNENLKKLLDQILTDSRWDMKFLGMQIIVEGLALAAFGVIRDTATNPLLRDLTAAVMEDEARHVAFGVLSLREFCLDLPEKDRMEREDFVFEACLLMRDRIQNREVWETMGMDADECIAVADESPLAQEFRRRLFSKIVPNVKSLGLLSDRQRARFQDIGILEFETNTTSDIDQEIEEERRRLSGADAA